MVVSRPEELVTDHPQMLMFVQDPIIRFQGS